MESDHATHAEREAGTDRAARGEGSSFDRSLTFFREFLRHPEQIGSIVPSSRFLERRVVEIAHVADAGVVVELGPGTGGTTRAVLRALARDARLLAIEINPVLASLLRSIADHRLIVHRGNAVDLGEALALHGLPDPQAVLSGIPFSTLPPGVGRRVLQNAWGVLAPGGRLVAYQFRARVAALGHDVLGPPDITTEVRNVPPMRVYSWRKPSAGGRKATV